MRTELHATICDLIDKSLAGTASPEEQQSVREHLTGCTACSAYLEAGNRAIAGLNGFRFEVDPELESKVLASLTARAQRLQRKSVERGSVREWSWLAAVTLTVAGSFGASQVAGAAAPILHIARAQWQIGLTTFWILPSLFICLLFLLLPGSTSTRVPEKGLCL